MTEIGQGKLSSSSLAFFAAFVPGYFSISCSRRNLAACIIESAQDDAEATLLQQKLVRTGTSITVRMVDNKRAFVVPLVPPR